MNKYYKEGTSHSPVVSLDPEGEITIKGESRPEDVSEFYGPISKWFEDWGSNLYYRSGEFDQEQARTVRFEYEYFNSSSAKKILDLLSQIAEIEASHKHINITVEWAYEADDDDIEDSGKELEEMSGKTMTFVAVTE